MRGETLVEPYLNDLSCYQRLCEVSIPQADGQWQSYRVSQVRRVGERLLLRFEGCESRGGVRMLTGLELYVRRHELPPAPVGDFYWFDLEGLTVFTEDGECLGQVE